MSKLMISSLLFVFAGCVLWMAAVVAVAVSGNPDNWIDAGTIVGVLGLVILYIDQMVEERRAK